MAQPTPPVHFESRLAVNAFIQQRFQKSGLTPTLLTQQLNLSHTGSVTNLLRGRQLLSRSKYFDQLCDLLNISDEERQAIRLAEQGGR